MLLNWLRKINSLLGAVLLGTGFENTMMFLRNGMVCRLLRYIYTALLVSTGTGVICLLSGPLVSSHFCVPCKIEEKVS